MIEIREENIPGWVRIRMQVHNDESLIVNENREEMGAGGITTTSTLPAFILDRTFYVDPRRIGNGFDGETLVQEALSAAANACFWVLPGIWDNFPSRDGGGNVSSRDGAGMQPEQHTVQVGFSEGLRHFISEFNAHDFDDPLDSVTRFWYGDMGAHPSTSADIDVGFFPEPTFENGTVPIIDSMPLAQGAEGGESPGPYRDSMLTELEPMGDIPEEDSGR